jgi:hypothetical protein
VEFFSKLWGDLSSVIGLVVSVVGLALTIWYARAAKIAAEEARDAAREARDRVLTLDAIGELSSAITIIQEIMRLQRTQAWDIVWDIVLDRYEVLRAHLVRSEAAAGLDGNHRASIRTAMGQFRKIVEDIEDAQTDQQRGQLNVAVFNRIIADEASTLERIKIALKKAGS